MEVDFAICHGSGEDGPLPSQPPATAVTAVTAGGSSLPSSASDSLAHSAPASPEDRAVTGVGAAADGAASQPVSRLLRPSARVTPRFHLPEEEIAYGPASWLWDYLRWAACGCAVDRGPRMRMGS